MSGIRYNPLSQLDKLVSSNVDSINYDKEQGFVENSGMSFRSGLHRFFRLEKSEGDVQSNRAALEKLLGYIERNTSERVREHVLDGKTYLPGDDNKEGYTVRERMERGTFVSSKLVAELRRLSHEGVELQLLDRGLERKLEPFPGLRDIVDNVEPERTPKGINVELLRKSHDFSGVLIELLYAPQQSWLRDRDVFDKTSRENYAEYLDALEAAGGELMSRAPLSGLDGFGGMQKTVQELLALAPDELGGLVPESRQELRAEMEQTLEKLDQFGKSLQTVRDGCKGVDEAFVDRVIGTIATPIEQLRKETQLTLEKLERTST